MGKSQRTKGFGAERELVNIFKSQGIPAKRSTCSFGADIELENGTRISVKRRANGMKWAYDELELYDRVYFRADRKDWLVIKRAFNPRREMP